MKYKKILKQLEMSEIATRNLPASARSKRAISGHELRNLPKQISGLLESSKLSNTQKHAPCFSTGSVFDKFEFSAIVISGILIFSYRLSIMYNLYQKITYPLQLITRDVIHFLQNRFGIQVVIDRFSLIYNNGLDIEIAPGCVGIEQLIFFFFMLSFFIGIDLKTKIKGFLSFAPIIIIANFLRLFMIYPLSLIYSIETTWNIHWFIFTYGQGFFLLLLVIIWYIVFVVRKR